jgi:2-C-methyl-D-erythritol 4-phosphate cytidylyltransferase/2-C-methyl-D-erythritol 2,4-cyclodiphosphate synthase
MALPPECSAVLVHDATRPFVSVSLTKRILEALDEGCMGVIPGFIPTDTVKQVDASGFVQATPDRSDLRCIQTPQGFRRDVLHAAHVECRSKGIRVTDDATMLELCKVKIKVVPGEHGNVKITNPDDLKLLGPSKNDAFGQLRSPCVGMGYDVHSYGGNRPFILGGVPIDTDIFIKAHSDGDVLLHALMDALLVCAAAGDIGQLFPDSDAAYDNVNSAMLLAEVLELVRGKNILLTHVDLTVIAQVPKIAPYNIEIKRNLAHLLHLDEKQVNLKATTEEGLGFTGAKLGIKAMAVVTGLRTIQP